VTTPQNCSLNSSCNWEVGCHQSYNVQECALLAIHLFFPLGPAMSIDHTSDSVSLVVVESRQAHLAPPKAFMQALYRPGPSEATHPPKQLLSLHCSFRGTFKMAKTQYQSSCSTSRPFWVITMSFQVSCTNCMRFRSKGHSQMGVHNTFLV